jgi:hypothetical protein
MNREGFRQYLHDRSIPKESIEQALALADRFEAFLREPGRPGAVQTARPEDLSAFIGRLMEHKENGEENLVTLVRYAWFGKNYPVYVAALELVDGAEVLENLYAKLGKEFGAEVRDEIFRGVSLPPLGTPTTERPRMMETLIQRLEDKAGTECARQLLGTGLRTLPDEGYLEEKKKYEQAGGIDAYLARKRRDTLSLFERLKREGRPFFAQMITDDVIEYVRTHPEVQQGVRVGNVIYESKIPYMTREYLVETDPRMKAYYYCHCPWVRESFLQGNGRVPSVFCNCSAAFHKKPWEVIFGQPLRADVLESVLKGDSHCRFAIHLPEDAL